MNVGNISPATTSAAASDRPKSISAAAQQFEGLLIGELLKSARGATEALGAGNTDQALSTALDFAHEQFAQAMAASGGMGIASMIRNNLNRK